MMLGHLLVGQSAVIDDIHTPSRPLQHCIAVRLIDDPSVLIITSIPIADATLSNGPQRKLLLSTAHHAFSLSRDHDDRE